MIVELYNYKVILYFSQFNIIYLSLIMFTKELYDYIEKYIRETRF